METTAKTAYKLWTAEPTAKDAEPTNWEPWGEELFDTWEGLVFAATLETIEGKKTAYTEIGSNDEPTPFAPNQFDSHTQEILNLLEESTRTTIRR